MNRLSDWNGRILKANLIGQLKNVPRDLSISVDLEKK
jgi:hypothetical protein